MKELILFCAMNLSALALSMENQDTQNILMITFPSKEIISKKLNATSLYIANRIGVLSSLENKTFSHLQVKAAVVMAVMEYNQRKDIVYIAPKQVKEAIIDLINAGNSPAKL